MEEVNSEVLAKYDVKVKKSQINLLPQAFLKNETSNRRKKIHDFHSIIFDKLKTAEISMEGFDPIVKEKFEIECPDLSKL